MKINNLIYLINMEQEILRQIALIFISNINECNKFIIDLEKKIKNRNSKEVDANIKQIIQKFNEIVNSSDKKFVLPEKVIDNILVLIIKFLDISFTNCNSIDFNCIEDVILIIIKFLNIEQNYLNLNLTKVEFILKKWKYIESLLTFILSLIDKFENSYNSNFKFDLQKNLKIVFEFLELAYLNVGENIDKKYKIMPGIISKMIKLISYTNLKISTKILKQIIKIFYENMEINFKIFKSKPYANDVERLYTNFEKNFFIFLDFYDLFHIKLKEKMTKKRIVKIIKDLCDLNIKFVKNINQNKEKLMKMNYFVTDKNNFEEIILLRNQRIFYFINNHLFNCTLLDECEYKDSYEHNYISNYKEIFNDSKMIYDKLNENIRKVSSALSKEEFNTIENVFPELFANFSLYLIKNYEVDDTYDKTSTGKRTDVKNENFSNIFSINIGEIDIVRILSSTSTEITSNTVDNSYLSLKNLLDNFYENVLEKLIKIKDNYIFEIANSYEILINDSTKSICSDKCKKILFEYIKKEIDLEKFLKFLNYIYKNYPLLYIYYQNISIKKLNKSLRNFKILFEREEFNIKVKQIQENFDAVLKYFYLIIFICIYTYHKDNMLNISDEYKNLLSKNYLALKQFVSYFYTFINEYHEKLNCLKISKILLLNSNLLIIYSFLLSYNRRIFNNQEKNSILIMALTNYSNKAELLKMSSILLFHELGSNDKLELKNFVINNFDFIINTTINKILYFGDIQIEDTKASKNYLTAISNFKIDILNLFNSLILLLKEVKDESLMNTYCGELNKFVKKLFNYLDFFYKQKNYFNLECLLEVIEKITAIQNEIVLNNFDSFKVECYEDFVISEIENDSNKFVEFLKIKVGISDTNIFRNLLLRLLPLLLSGKVSLVYKTLKIYSNLINTLYLLPMTREEKTNFSTEDAANVLIRSSLAPMIYESWDYFLYVMNKKFCSSASTISTQKLIIELFIEVNKHYQKFFTESRIFSDFLPLIEENIYLLLKDYSFDQIYNLISLVIEFFYQIINKKIDLKFKFEGRLLFTLNNSKNLVNFLANLSSDNLKIEDRQKINDIMHILNIDNNVSS